jgi:hypothetical protein
MNYNPVADTATKLLDLIGTELGNWKGTTEKAIRVESSNSNLEPEGLLCVIRKFVSSNPYRSGNLQVFSDATLRVSLIQYNSSDTTTLLTAFEKIQLAFNVKSHSYQSNESSEFFEQCYLDVLVPYTNQFNEP